MEFSVNEKPYVGPYGVQLHGMVDVVVVLV
jgi:hypothetical protein